MAGKSDALEARVLDHLFKGGATPALAALSTVYVGLGTDTNTDAQREAGTFTEVSGNAYARASIPAASLTRTGNSITTNVDVLFPTATPAGWGTITNFQIWDAASAGNLLYWGTVGSVVVNANDQPKFAAGNLTITED